MPTTKEIEDAQQQIHDLVDLECLQGPNGAAQVGEGMDAPENVVGFFEIEPKDQFSFLATQLSWDGFTNDQTLDIIDRVMDGHGPEQWMDGIVASDQQPVFEEIRADEHSARVRDFGEADAAGYEARMAEAYAVQADALELEPMPGPPITPEVLDEIERGWSTFDELLEDAAARISY